LGREDGNPSPLNPLSLRAREIKNQSGVLFPFSLREKGQEMRVKILSKCNH
jgi:hypothetical protein